MTTIQHASMLRFAAAVVSLALVGSISAGPAAAAVEPHGTLSAFRSEAELAAYLKKLHRAQPAQPAMSADAEAMPPPPPPPPAPGAMAATAGRTASITNNQEQGVDEGDIIKNYGDNLVILRR